VADVVRLEMPMELRLELGSVVSLHDVNAKRQALPDLIDEPDRRPLVACIVDLEDANAGAVIYGRELIQPFARARDPFKELHVELQPVSGLRLLVPLPALLVGLMFLVRREPWHPVALQDAMDRRTRDRDGVKPLQIVRDLAGSKVIVLPQVQNLADDVPACGAWRSVRRARPIVQARRAKFVKTPFPFVKGLPRNPEMATGVRHIAGGLAGLLQHPEPPRPQPLLLCFRHRVSESKIFRQPKTLLTLPSLWTHRTRPQGLGNYKTVSTAPTALILCSRKTSAKQKRARTVNPVLGFHTKILGNLQSSA